MILVSTALQLVTSFRSACLQQVTYGLGLLNFLLYVLFVLCPVLWIRIGFRPDVYSIYRTGNDLLVPTYLTTYHIVSLATKMSK
jgi:hypothetical protein